MNNFNFRKTTLATAVLISLNSVTVAAQGMLEEVVVTAQKRAESLQDVPVAVSAFQGDDLENFGVTDTMALQLVTPSLVFNNRGPIAQPFIRGIGTTLSLLGLEPSVATYVDDQYYPRPAGTIMELPDIERIEVLKGPQGTLYGRNATGGAIRVVTRDPSDELSGKFKLTAGDYNLFKASAYVEGALSDSVRANFSVLHAQRDGFAEQQTPGLDDLDDLDVLTLRSKWVFDVSDSVTAKLALDYTSRDDTAGSDTIDITSDKSILRNFPGAIGPSFAESLGNFPVGGNAVTGKSLEDTRSGVDTPNEQDIFNAQLRFDVEMDGMVFSSMTTYQDSDREMNTSDFDASTLRLSDITDYEKNESFSQEFQLLSDTDGNFSWMAGLYYFESEGEYQLLFDGRDLVLTGFNLIASPISRLDNTAWAIFGQMSYDFNDAWSLTVGARYSDEDKDIQSDVLQFPITPIGSINDSASFDEFTPKVTAEYNWDNGMAYLSYSVGFKSGGFPYPYIEGRADQTVESEILTSWELGIKADLADNSLRLNGAVYFYDYEDLQVNRNAGFVPGVGPVLPVENAGGAEVYGVEMDITWAPNENLMITGGFNAMDTEYTDYQATPSVYNTVAIPGPVVAAVPYDANGDDLIRAPDLSAYVSLNYDVNLGNGGRMPLTLTYSHTGEFNFDLIPGDDTNRIDELEHDAYQILNARLAYYSPDERWNVALWANNLTDEEYYDEVVSFATAVRASVGVPRTYGVDLSFNF